MLYYFCLQYIPQTSLIVKHNLIPQTCGALLCECIGSVLGIQNAQKHDPALEKAGSNTATGKINR